MNYNSDIEGTIMKDFSASFSKGEFTSSPGLCSKRTLLIWLLRQEKNMDLKVGSWEDLCLSSRS